MKLPKPLAFALAAFVASLGPGASATAHATHGAQHPPQVQRLLVQQMLLLGRGFLDYRLERLAIEPGTNALVLSGLRLFPTVGQEGIRKCEISIDRLVIDGTFGLNVISIGSEATDARVPSACFGPEAGDILASAGYESVVFDTASMDVTYSLPESSARLAVRIAVRDAALLGLDAEFERLWLRQPLFGEFDAARLSGEVGQAELTVEDLGLARRVETIVQERAGLGGPNIPQLLQAAFLQMLGMDGSRPLTEAERAFAEQLSAGVSALWDGQEPLAVTVNPVDDVSFDDMFRFSVGDRLEVLRPSVSNLPSALRSIVPPADLAAALDGAAGLDDASRTRIGTALLTGDGAPRSIEAGARILLPVARNGSGEAAVTLARAYRSVGRNEEAYRMALMAMASGEPGSVAVTDELEPHMALAEIMAIQDEVGGDWPGTAAFEAAVDAAVADGDVRAVAGHAHAAAAGRDVPRSFGTAYMLATLAAAAGDHGAARLRDRLDRRFRGDAWWRSASGKASDEAMALWIDGGMGDAVLGAAASAGSWCPDGGTFAEFSFTLENGRTVSICESTGSPDLTYYYGVLGKPPELEFRGPLRGTIEGIGGYSHDLAGLGEFGFDGPQADADVSQEAVAAAAASLDTGGFFLVRSLGCCGGEETAVLFRRGGWEYAVRIGYSRNVNPDAVSEFGDHSEWKLITLISPDGQDITVR